jgi:hypothetical protein
MFILGSRNANLDQKKFIKYLCNFLFGLKFIPRGKTSLKKLFEKSKYFSYNYFLLCSKVRGFKDKLLLNIYKLDGSNYLLDKKYIISNIKYVSSISKIKNMFVEINDFKDIFYFLDNKYKSKDEYYTYKLDSNNKLSFICKDKELGFSFNLEKVIIC